MLDEVIISRAIIERYNEKLQNSLDLDVAIAGAGPAGMTAAYHIANAGLKVAIFEKKLAPGGGMWGGGMLFNEIVVQEDGKRILDEFGIKCRKYKAEYYTADSIESVAKILAKTMDAGAKVFNCFSVEDTMIKGDRVCGFVVNWTPVEMAGLHVDPLTVRCKYAIEATGHPLAVLSVLEKKYGKDGKPFNTETGRLLWERSMDATAGEKAVVENTREVFPGIYVIGMASNAVYGSPRMGPIFGGMLLSGEKAAKEIISKLKNE